jgi:hypothetical protein
MRRTLHRHQPGKLAWEITKERKDKETPSQQDNKAEQWFLGNPPSPHLNRSRAGAEGPSHHKASKEEQENNKSKKKQGWAMVFGKPSDPPSGRGRGLLPSPSKKEERRHPTPKHTTRSGNGSWETHRPPQKKQGPGAPPTTRQKRHLKMGRERPIGSQN